MSNNDVTVRNIFIAIMLVTIIAGYDIAHSETPTVQAQELVVTVSSPTPTLKPVQSADKVVVEKVSIKPTTCQGAIEEVFGDLAPQAERVSFCESSFNTGSKHNTSTAKGCFQILNGTWKQFKCIGDPLNALDNTKCAKKIYDHYNSWNTTGGWRASYKCHEQN